MSFTPEVYEQIREGAKRSAAAVVPAVYEMVKPETVVDVGGGEGWWANEFAFSHGCSALVLDESWPLESTSGDTEEFWPGEVGHRHAKLDTLDPIMVPTPKAGRFDLALCLEVGEHLAEEFAAPLVNRLCQLAPVVLWSAAIPGQGGLGHVNEQWPAYWMERFTENGYLAVDVLRSEFWEDERVEPWYRQNMLIYASLNHDLDHLPFADRPVGTAHALVHPVIFGWRVAERDAATAVVDGYTWQP